MRNNEIAETIKEGAFDGDVFLSEMERLISGRGSEGR